MHIVIAEIVGCLVVAATIISIYWLVSEIFDLRRRVKGLETLWSGHDGEDCPFPTAREVDGAEERARIRQELLEWIEREERPEELTDGWLIVEVDGDSGLRAALDRIAPAPSQPRKGRKEG